MARRSFDSFGARRRFWRFCRFDPMFMKPWRKAPKEEVEEEEAEVGVVSFLDAGGRGGERIAASPAPISSPSSVSAAAVAVAAAAVEEDLKGLGLGILLLSLVGSRVRTEEQG